MSTKEKFRVINFRCFPVIAIALVIAIFTCLLAVTYPISGFILFGLLLVGLLIAAVLTRKRRLCVPITFALAAVLAAVACTVFYCDVKQRNELDFTQEHATVGEVYAAAIRDGEGIFLLDGVRVGGKSVSGRLEIHVESVAGTVMEFAKPGDRIAFSGNLYEVCWVNGLRVNATAYRDRVRLRAYPEVESCTLTFGTMTGLQAIRARLYAALETQLGEDYADLAYGMLTGDKRGLSLAIRDYISISGLGHILAVSGLHIGFIAAAVLFLLKRCPGWVRCAVTSVILLLYMIFVGFTPSVVRAVVMCETGLLTLVGGQRRDPLSSLALAMTVILTAMPISMFDIGFIMSCSAVFAIICFSRMFTRGLRKIHVPRKIAAAISVSASAQLGILPATIYYFHSIQVYSILTNVLLMPLISLTFILLLFSCLAVLIVPAAAILLKGVGVCLAVLDAVAYGVSCIPFASILIYGSVAAFLAYICYFLISPFFMLPRGKRWVRLGAWFAAAACMLVPAHYFRDYNAIIPVDGYRDVTSVVSTGRDVYLIGDCNDGDALHRTLQNCYARNIKAVFLTGLTEENAKQLVMLRQTYAIGTVYFPATRTMQGVHILVRDGADLRMLEQGDDVPIRPVYKDGDFQGYAMRERERDILFLGYRTRYTDLAEEVRARLGVVRCYMYLNRLPEYIFITNLPAWYLGETPFFQVSPRSDPGIVFDYRNGATYIRG